MIDNYLQLYILTWRKYFVFEGRSSRREYWTFTLLNVVVVLLIQMVAESALWIFWLVSIVPIIALGIRRLHDISRSGWWIVVTIIPFVGFVFMLVWALIPGDKARNDYGEVPVYKGFSITSDPFI